MLLIVVLWIVMQWNPLTIDAALCTFQVGRIGKAVLEMLG